MKIDRLGSNDAFFLQMTKIKDSTSRASDESACYMLLGVNFLFFGGLLALMLLLPMKTFLAGSSSDEGAAEAHLAAADEAVVGEDISQSAGQTAYAVCSACHGAEGQGNAMLKAPALAGQDAWYLKRQILKFKDGLRGTHAEDTAGATMRPMAMMLQHDAQIDAVVEYIVSFPAVHSELTLGGDAAKGQVPYLVCQACHGPEAEGNKVMNAPRLNGLPDWYIVTQLKHFKGGIRGKDPKDVEGMQMAPMAGVLADEAAMADVAAYINSKGSAK